MNQFKDSKELYPRVLRIKKRSHNPVGSYQA